MVKIVLSLFIFISFSFANNIATQNSSLQNVVEIKEIDLLSLKIQTFIDKDIYKQNKAYIDIIFSPKSDYFRGDKVDSVKVIHTLKENGLLNLFFKKPTNIELSFRTSGSPLFFIKIMGNTLQNIGYYRYVTKESTLNNTEFTWNISLTSEYATDPLILQKELAKSGCEIVDIQKVSDTEWTYIIDMRDGHLNVKSLQNAQEIKLKRSLYAHWLDISSVTRLKILSSRRNNWYPKISYYDNSLHLLKVITKNKKMRKMILNIPRSAKYIKISDIYTLKNVKDSLVLFSTGLK